MTAERHEFWLALAEEEGRAASIDVPAAPVPIPVATLDLVAAIDALYGNVVSHTPIGTGYSTTLKTTGDEAVLRIADEGPGFSDPNVLDRGRSTSGSSGLGLDIVRSTAAAAGGSVRIETATPHGAVIEVRFPLLEA